MRYENIVKATFLERPNRFIAYVSVDGKSSVAHVKNTGRCKELLIPGAVVYLDRPIGKNRKTEYDLVAVEKESLNGKKLINLDSSAPNAAVSEWLPKSGMFAGNSIIRREVTKGNSRFDFCITEFIEEVEKSISKTTYLEVKGVTLEDGGVAMFPDAPTERGVKHLYELSELSAEGYGAVVIFVVQMKGIYSFMPNKATHPEFCEALKYAKDHGVQVLVYDSEVEPNSMKIDMPIKLLI